MEPMQATSNFFSFTLPGPCSPMRHHLLTPPVEATMHMSSSPSRNTQCRPITTPPPLVLIPLTATATMNLSTTTDWLNPSWPPCTVEPPSHTLSPAASPPRNRCVVPPPPLPRCSSRYRKRRSWKPTHRPTASPPDLKNVDMPYDVDNGPTDDQCFKMLSW
jgi:hypothetical protein